MSDYTVYIDEAGDLGVKRGTQWFVLSAVVVEKTEEPRLRAAIERLRARLNVRELHLRNIQDFNKRSFLTRELSRERFTYMSVLVDTSKLDTSNVPTASAAYNYACKRLLQRVSWFLEQTGETADVVLSARGTARDGELIRYLQSQLLPNSGNGINAETFDKISAKAAATWDLLQLADLCATTMFLAVEVNGYGFCTPCFAYALEDHLLQRGGAVEGYGIQFFTPDMTPDPAALRERRVCTKKERTPSATTTCGPCW